MKLSNRLVVTNNIFEHVIHNKERESNYKEVHVSRLVVVSDELYYDRIKDLWELKLIGINVKNDVSQTTEEISEQFSENTTYNDKRFEI